MMNRISHGGACAFFAALIAVAVSTQTASAAVFTFTDQASFLGAVSNSTTLDFEGLAAGSTIAPGDTVEGVTFDFALGVDLMVDDQFGTTSGTNYLGADDAPDNLFFPGDTFTMSALGDLIGIGLYVIVSPEDEIFAGDFSLDTSSGQSVINSDVFDADLGDGFAYFLGIIDTDGFSSADLVSGLNGADASFVVDDITSVVPEPSTALLLGLGIAVLGGRRRLA